MRRIFLGKPVHWLVPILAAAALGATGSVNLHVTDFNLYTLSVGATAIAIVVLLLATTRRGERVTREPLPGPDDPMGGP